MFDVEKIKTRARRTFVCRGLHEPTGRLHIRVEDTRMINDVKLIVATALLVTFFMALHGAYIYYGYLLP